MRFGKLPLALIGKLPSTVQQTFKNQSQMSSTTNEDDPWEITRSLMRFGKLSFATKAKLPPFVHRTQKPLKQQVKTMEFNLTDHQVTLPTRQIVIQITKARCL
jgi:hypothetical protein